MKQRGGKRSGAGRPKLGGVEHRWIVPQDIHDIAKDKGIQYIWDAVRFKVKFDKLKEATIAIYPTYAHVEYDGMTCDIEFENLKFESKEDISEWVNNILVDFCPYADNYHEIASVLERELDKYRL